LAGGPLVGAARLGGPLLLTALVFAGGAGLAEVAGRLRRTTGPARSGMAGMAGMAGMVALVAVVAVGVAGALAPDGGPAVATLRVAAVQGGGVRGFTALETGRAGDFAAELAATEPLVWARPRPELVLWPEDVIAIGVPVAASTPGRAVSALALRLRATVLAGVTVLVGTSRFRNEIVAWGPDGRILGEFEKVHRVPFGEYVPFRGFFSHLASLAAVPRDAIAGHGTGLLRTPAAPVGVLVSFEVFFAGRARSSVRAGARLLVVPTNTSSYSSEQMPSQEVAADQVQAVSEGRDLVQASPTGYSTFVTNTGVVTRQSGLSERAVLSGPVALRRGATVYARFGDLPVLVLAGLGVAAGLAAELRWRRRAGAGHPDGAPPSGRRLAHRPEGGARVGGWTNPRPC
jgi:apolipoprotein N-acyltransferase